MDFVLGPPIWGGLMQSPCVQKVMIGLIFLIQIVLFKKN